MGQIEIKPERAPWRCTDSSQGQFGRQVEKFQYEFKDDATEPVIVDITEYNKQQTERIINSYGYTLHASVDSCVNIQDEYGEEANWIIAECIFETEYSQYQDLDKD